MFKMARVLSYLLLLLQTTLFASCASDTKESMKQELDTVKKIYFLKQDLNISNIFSEILQIRSTENKDCFNELKAISNGLTNLDKWAINIVDSWGTIPSGFLNGNRNSLGSFSECFHIKQNGNDFKTQYCIGQIKFQSRNDPNKIENIFTIFQDDSTISIGICLPASCSVDHLESAINEVIQRKIGDIRITIPKTFCQFEENNAHLGTLDFYIFGLLGIVLILVIASTSYDVYYTLSHRTKYLPFVIFSIYTNGMKLFSCQNSNNSDMIDCIKGIRVLSTLWIIYGHVVNIYILLPLQEPSSLFEFMGSYRGKIAFSVVAVDSFLTISGLLLSKKLFYIIKKNGKLNIFPLYFYRYMRLTPFLCICFLLTMSFLRFLGNGPVWPISDFFIGNCPQYWWSLLLHTQNYVNPNQICFFTSWYLSVDTQLFLIAPAIVYSIHRYRAKALIGLFGLILGSVGCTLAVHASHNFRNIMEARFVELSYSPTHLRFPAWLIGFITGYILSECPNGSIRIPKKLNFCGWILSLLMLATSIFASVPMFERYPTHTSLTLGLHLAISRIAWSTGLCYIIFACAQNAGGPVNRFLSHSYWELFSRLSYGVYLVHYPILMMTMFSAKAPLYFSELSSIQYFIGTTVLSCLVSILAMLAFEIPIYNIYKLIANPKNVSKALNSVNEQNNLNCENGVRKNK